MKNSSCLENCHLIYLVHFKKWFKGFHTKHIYLFSDLITSLNWVFLTSKKSSLIYIGIWKIISTAIQTEEDKIKAQSRAFELAHCLSDDLMSKSTEISSDMGFQLWKNFFWLILDLPYYNLVVIPAIKIIPIHFLQLPLYFSYSSAKWTSWGYRTVFYFWTGVGKLSKCQRWRFKKVKISCNIANAGKLSQEYSKMIKK